MFFKDLLLLQLFFCLVLCNKYTKEGCTIDNLGNEQCLKKDEYEEDDDDEPVFYDEVETSWKDKEPLFQWDPVEVGHVRDIEMPDGSIMKLKTAAVKPKVFVIDDFLSEKECEHVIEKAKYFGLGESGLHIDDKIKAGKIDSYGRANETFGDFSQWDINRDGQISLNEVLDLPRRFLKLYLNETDIKQMFEYFNCKAFDDSIITGEEFQTLNTIGIAGYLTHLREEHPRFRDRFSEQIWLKQGDQSDQIMKKMREKVIKLTNLPRYVVEGGEPLQVLHYQPFGHYHAHFDGQDAKAYPGYKCCHLDVDAQPLKCRLCRFITILYYLRDVEEGGETAFPVADKDEYNHDEFRERKVDDYYNLSKFCSNASLVVKAKRGRAVLWYNHHLDKNGFLGDMDYWGLHGGCDVKKGEKWVANNWIPAPPTEEAHLESLYSKLDAMDAF